MAWRGPCALAKISMAFPAALSNSLLRTSMQRALLRIMQAKSTGKLVQSLAVFKACSIGPLVANADTIIRVSRAVAAPLVDEIVKRTMFRHFCGGECVDSIQPTLKVRAFICCCWHGLYSRHMLQVGAYIA